MCAPNDGGRVPDTSRIQMRILSRLAGEHLRFLRSSGVIAGYDHALLHSVKDAVSSPYPDGPDAVGMPAHREAAGHVGTPAHREMVVTTSHQAKGRERDVVVGSLSGQQRLFE